MKILTIIARSLLGLIFVVFGLNAFLDFIPPVLWFAAKVVVFLYFYLWFRASWPRYRYDQLMKVGWQYLLPLAIANVIVTAILVVLLRK